MSNAIETVKKINAAFENKDKAAFRRLLDDQYAFQGPLMQMNGADEAAAFMEKCPMKAKSKNVQFIASGDQVVQTFDWVVTEPFQATIRMCDVLTVRNGKILKEELFYDSAKFPKEALEKMKEMMGASV